MVVQKLLQHVVTSLVDAPEAVTVNLTKTDDKTVLEIRVAQSDLAKVIGKEGRTFKVIRMLGAAVGGLQERDIILDSLK